MHPLSASPKDRLARAAGSLEGLSIGDAFGEQFFTLDAEQRIADRRLRSGLWRFTDDTLMALSVASVLRQAGEIHQDLLARSFSERYETGRGYGPAMHNYLPTIWELGEWRTQSRRLFNGQGSFGNGAAMRVAPIGAYFADNLDEVVAHAERSAEVTHAHPEAVAGAIAVAMAAAEAARMSGTNHTPRGSEFLDPVARRVPDSEVKARLRYAGRLAIGTPVRLAVAALGNGTGVSAQDTVPFALWCASCHLDNFEEALWLTVSGLGDRDTTCAIVGGVVASYTGVEGIPAEWQLAREPLPRWPFEEAVLNPGAGYARNQRPVGVRGRVIIVEDGKIALIKRVRDGRTYYVFPGGAVEDGETPEEAAAREALEELGLRVEVGHLVAVQEFQGCEHRFYMARVLGGTFGNGNGPEYARQREPRDTLYLPVWLDVGKLDELDVRPPTLAAALRLGEIKRWRGRRIDEE